jgi:hypothetical protein
MIDRYCRCILFLMCFTFILGRARRILGWAGPTWPPICYALLWRQQNDLTASKAVERSTREEITRKIDSQKRNVYLLMEESPKLNRNPCSSSGRDIHIINRTREKVEALTTFANQVEWVPTARRAKNSAKHRRLRDCRPKREYHA